MQHVLLVLCVLAVAGLAAAFPIDGNFDDEFELSNAVLQEYGEDEFEDAARVSYFDEAFVDDEDTAYVSVYS